MTTPPKKGQEVIRLTRVELAQHWVLMVTLLGLALTGLALFAHGTWVGKVLMGAGRGHGIPGHFASGFCRDFDGVDLVAPRLRFVFPQGK